MSFFEVFEVKMEVSDLRSDRDLNFRVELTKLDLSAKFQLPSFNRDFRAPDLNFSCKSSLNATQPPLIFGHRHIQGGSQIGALVQDWVQKNCGC